MLWQEGNEEHILKTCCKSLAVWLPEALLQPLGDRAGRWLFLLWLSIRRRRAGVIHLCSGDVVAGQEGPGVPPSPMARCLAGCDC